MRVRNKAGPIDPHCGPSWNESSKTNLGWYGAASSDSAVVSSTRCSVKPYRPSCRSSQATAENRPLGPSTTQRVDKFRLYTMTLAEFDVCPGASSPLQSLSRCSPSDLFTHEFDFSRPSSRSRDTARVFSTNRYECRGLGYNPVLYLPRPRHNQNGERINSDETLLERCGGASNGIGVESFPFVITEYPISFIHQREDRLCSPNPRKPARHR